MSSIILNFESNSVILDWEKYYPARQIMKVVGYNKWERFLGAINRAVDWINDREIIEKNFIFRTIKNTWWRPKEDVFLTIEWVLYVLKASDQRKMEVWELTIYIEELIKNIELNNKNLWRKKIFNFYFILFFIIIFLIFWYFFTRNFLKLKEKTDSFFVSKVEIEKMMLKDFINFNKYTNLGEKNINNNEDNISNSLENIVDISKLELNEVNSEINKRSSFTENLKWEDLIQAFFAFWNIKNFRDSCSLLSKELCNVDYNYNSEVYKNYWEKVNWEYNLNSVKEIPEMKWHYCVNYDYLLKNDISWNKINETMHYVIDEKNWNYEISKRMCEQITKNWRNIPCPFELNNYYCLD